MPKEQPCLSEHSPCATSSMNAKDERNSTTLLAMRETKDADDSSGRGSLCSSEKDSGYSDCSDWQHMDVEDQHSDKSQSRGSECAETSQPGQNRERGQRNSENSTLMLAGRELPPIYIIDNMGLKQTPQLDTIQKKGQLLWRNKSLETSTSGAPQIVLPTTRQPHKPLSRKPNIMGKKRNGKYLPIFNSYSRIAPHPSKKPPDISLSNEKLQNRSENVCTEHKSDSTPGTRSLLDQHLNKQPKLAFSCSSSPRDTVSSSTSAIACSSQGSPSASTVHTTGSSSLLASRGLQRNGTTNVRHRRFLNTLEILGQSGLLDIALRTKELLRQSNAIEQDISQLRQHTELLCQTASNPSLNGVTAWEPLHRAMSESCSYPNLKLLHNLQTPPHPDSSGQPVSINTVDSEQPATESSAVSPSHCPPALLDPNQNCPVSPYQSEQSRELATGGKVTFTPPDSSTG
ncbi:CLOCK-interacting pacemaker-like [Hippoglossus hippoglossus]|uniref:CLOCK-interacting pacemaker-like n=1 Tax=Hippoglossus hippoglossus TaxID=8267 RepID=UPI00148BD4EB|nr:CLOCK-interacting pacemaker-like [Hippoglossus hippoglossus]XP_034459274.1 CLOCK-interacting pacemaker-like [Hippoglossus hippoglossus]XP_034459275.1 CLOCK-interacting pacemaker-like [Hippoglossus hippoglossus]XP_034459276.1 CLOCK-interacting pacemaker-like [Hippoglossus hippoglossus]XP_034459277.1 CLOCK-interacting pacemaker-like [Hippoglossus hippoglossus]